MTATPPTDELIDAALALAEEIGRLCPNAAEQATQLCLLIGQLRPVQVDRGAIQDAIDLHTVDTDISETQVRSTTDAVVKAARES